MTKLQEEFKRISDEWEENSYERVAYRQDFSKNGQQRWDELWARGLELEKQYYKLKAKLEAERGITVGS